MVLAIPPAANSLLASQLQKHFRPAAFLFAPKRHDNSHERQNHISPTRCRRGGSRGNGRRRNWRQRAGISRAAVSAIEGERLSPSVATALALAAVFECSVEELFGRGGNFQIRNGPQLGVDAAQANPAVIGRAEIGTRRLLYPVEAMNLNPTPHDGVWQNGVLRDSGSRGGNNAGDGELRSGGGFARGGICARFRFSFAGVSARRPRRAGTAAAKTGSRRGAALFHGGIAGTQCRDRAHAIRRRLPAAARGEMGKRHRAGNG